MTEETHIAELEALLKEFLKKTSIVHICFGNPSDPYGHPCRPCDEELDLRTRAEALLKEGQ